jgi:hypothetical protein
VCINQADRVKSVADSRSPAAWSGFLASFPIFRQDRPLTSPELLGTP